MLQRFFGRLRIYGLSKLRAIMEPSEQGVKRPSPEETQESEENAKRQKTGSNVDRKRKCVIMFGYNGKGYFGLQRNHGFKTIELDLCQALLDAGLIPLEHFEYMHKMSFQRAARTDKGVSAAGNCVSLKMLMNKENLVDEINSRLPSQIRVFDCFRTTQGFNSKNHCDARTYSYVLPTYAFLHKDKPLMTLDYRIDADTLEKANVVLNLFRGTHNFHNYTSGIKPTEKCATRFIIDFECRTPFVRNGLEFCEISVKGQSFMLHQIRKMVGTTIAVLKGYIDEDYIQETFKHNKICLPKAPALGLMLAKLHYPVYNKRHGSDHTKIDFERLKDIIEPFKEEVILSPIYKTELEEYSMLKWLPELEGLSFIPDEENQSEELMIRREEKHLAANRFIYGPDYIAPEKTDFTKSNEAEPEMDITTKLEDCSSGGLANQKAANQGPPSDIPTNGGGEFACSAGIEKYDIKDNKQTSNVKSGVVSDEIDKDSNVNVETTKSESVLEEGAR